MAATSPNRRIPPDLSKSVYMLRWWVWRVRWLSSLYINYMQRSDDDRALHDHPWFNVSIVLEGGYWEHMPNKRKLWRAPGDIVIRWRPSWQHRLELAPEHATGKPWSPNILQPALSLFFTGPAIRRWGFQDPVRGWIDAKEWDNHSDMSSPVIDLNKLNPSKYRKD